MEAGAAVVTLLFVVVGLAQFISTLLTARNRAIDDKLKEGQQYQAKINQQYETIVDQRNRISQLEAQLDWYRNQYKVYKAYSLGLKEGKDMSKALGDAELDAERTFDTKPLPDLDRGAITNLGEE